MWLTERVDSDVVGDGDNELKEKPITTTLSHSVAACVFQSTWELGNVHF